MSPCLKNLMRRDCILNRVSDLKICPSRGIFPRALIILIVCVGGGAEVGVEEVREITHFAILEPRYHKIQDLIVFKFEGMPGEYLDEQQVGRLGLLTDAVSV